MAWSIGIMNELDRLQQDIENAFSRYGMPRSEQTYPLLNVYETGEAITVIAEVPGAAKEDIKISLNNNVLKLSGKKKSLEIPENANLLKQERCCGEFEKSLELPVKADEEKISAELTNGLLKIHIPKASDSKAKQIFIQ